LRRSCGRRLTRDVDLIVEFERNTPLHPFDTYFGLKEELEALFGRKVDQVELSAVRNPYLRASIEASREPLFES
jgi:predicted nucleotidyltransferase